MSPARREGRHGLSPVRRPSHPAEARDRGRARRDPGGTPGPRPRPRDAAPPAPLDLLHPGGGRGAPPAARRVPQAGGGGGAARDDQPQRPPGADHGRHRGPDWCGHHHHGAQLAAPLPARARGRLRALRVEGERPGRLLPGVGGGGAGERPVAGAAVRRRRPPHRLPEVVVRRGRGPRGAADARRVPKTRRPPEGAGPTRRPEPRPHARRRAGLGLPPPVGVWRRRDRPERSDGRAELEGGARVGPVDDGVLEGGVRRGRARVGRHQQQPGLPRGRDQRDPERRLDLHLRQA